MKNWIKDDKFVELSAEEIKNLSNDEMVDYAAAQRKDINDKIQAKIDAGLKASKEEIEASKEAYTKEVDAIKKASLEQGKQIKKLLDVLAGQPLTSTEKNQIANFIEENKDKIKEIYSQKSGMIEFTTKQVGTITTGSASLPVAAPALVGTQDAPAGNVNLRGVVVDGLINQLQTSLASYPYTETVPKDGDYGFVGEGVIKPQIDFKIETRWASPKKVAAHMVLSEESVTDIVGLQNIATNYLRAKHDLKRQNGILFGDGNGSNPKGATTYGRAFVAGGMANKVKNTNFMDVVNACIADIFTTHNYTDEMPYLANIVMVNPIDFFINLVSAKDLNGLPLYPMASLFNRVVIGGAVIIPFEDIPAGKIFVADMSKYNVTNYVPYTVKIGYINDQLIYNLFTIVGESRFHAFVKKLDEQAFIYDDIATIEDAITVIA